MSNKHTRSEVAEALRQEEAKMQAAFSAGEDYDVGVIEELAAYYDQLPPDPYDAPNYGLGEIYDLFMSEQMDSVVRMQDKLMDIEGEDVKRGRKALYGAGEAVIPAAAEGVMNTLRAGGRALGSVTPDFIEEPVVQGAQEARSRAFG